MILRVNVSVCSYESQLNILDIAIEKRIMEKTKKRSLRPRSLINNFMTREYPHRKRMAKKKSKFDSNS
jgi:hypothetical protein